MVKKLTNEYKSQLDNLSDKEVVARFDLVMESFIELYKIYIINSMNFGVDKGLNAWAVLRNYRKMEFGYTNTSRELYDVSLNPNQLDKKDTAIISNLIYQYASKIVSGKIDISTEVFRYYKPFVFDYIKEYRPHLIQEVNKILVNKYNINQINKKSADSKDSKTGLNKKPRAV